MEHVITVRQITRRYGTNVALDNVSFTVRAGEIFGLLGPNGAGKTTLIEILEGVRRLDEGSAEVLGFNPQERSEKFKEAIGVQLQHTAIFKKIKVWEAIDFFSNIYRTRLATEELLERFQLERKREAYIRHLSGGEVQRLSVALAFVNDPQLLFLDEPTTGMDPQARRQMWSIFEQVRQEGKTIMLTTHYMEEAQRLCDRVAIIDVGKILTLGTPGELIRQLGAAKKIYFSIAEEVDPKIFRAIGGVEAVERQNRSFTLYSKTPETVLSTLFGMATEKGIHVEGLQLTDATLEDVFLNLTGKSLNRENGLKGSGARNEAVLA